MKVKLKNGKVLRVTEEWSNCFDQYFYTLEDNTTVAVSDVNVVKEQ